MEIWDDFWKKERKTTRKPPMQTKELKGTQNSCRMMGWLTIRLKISSKNKNQNIAYTRKSNDFKRSDGDCMKQERERARYSPLWIYEAIGNKRKLTIQNGLKCSRLK